MADDITVGSVAVDIVPDTKSFRRDLNAKLQGISTKVEVDADTSGVRAQIENASKTRPANIRVKVDDAEAKSQLAALQGSLKDKSLALDLSTAEAKAEVAALQAQIAEIKGNADLDTDEAKRRIAELQGQIKTLRAKIEADTAPARAEIARLRADVAAQRIAVKVEADTAPAEAAIDRTARDRTSEIKTRVDNSDLLSTVQGFGALTSAALTLGPALIPIAATVAAIGLGLAAPLAIAAGGATVFGFLTGFAIKQTEEQKKKIDQLAKSVATAKQALANTQASASTSAANSLATAQASAAASLKSARQALANATTAAQRRSAQQRIEAAQTALSARTSAIQRSQSASVEAAQRKVTAATAAYQAALKGLTPAQKKFLDAQTALKGAFQGLIETAGPKILGPVTQALTILTGILPNISPLIDSVSGALTGLLTDLGKSVKSPGFTAFVAAFSQQVGPDIVQFAHIAGGAIKGFTGLVFALGDAFGPTVLNGLQSLTDQFAAFGGQAGNSRKLQEFADYFQRVGPQVGDAIGAVAKAVGHVVEALAPLGPPALKIIEGIANQISGIPIPVLTGMTAAFGALVLASKASKGFSALKLLSGNATGGLLGNAGAAASLKPIHVWVDNPGFAGGGGKGGSPVVTGAGGAGGAAAAEAEAAKAAAAAAAAVKAAGGGVGAQSSAAARAFKEAMAAHDAAVLKNALDFGIKGGARGLLGTLLAAPAGITLGDAGNEQKQLTPFSTAQLQDIFVKTFGGSKKLPSADTLTAFGLSAPQARSLLGLKDLTATTTKVDGLRASLDKASTGFDIVGHSAHRNFGSVTADAAALKAKLDAIKAKEIRVILQDQAAIRSLQALQAFRLKDKTLTINEEERVVGPGGGIGHPLAPATQPSGSSRGGSGGGAGPAVQINGPVHIADTNDLLRKSHDALVARAGGGVALRPGATAVFG